MKILIIFSLIIFPFFNVIAQPEVINFHNLTTGMGLSHGDVKCFCQDHDGFQWIGTADGLNKFDGIEFTVYKNDKKDTTSIPYNYINCIYEDKLNNLWIGLPSGLCRYNRDKNNFEKISMIANSNQNISSQVNKIFEDTRGRLWIGCDLGIYLFDRKANRFTQHIKTQLNASDKIPECTGICQDKNGILWFSFLYAKDYGLIKYNPETNTIIRFSTKDPGCKLTENDINCLMIDNHDNLWIGYYTKGIDVLDEQNKLIASYKNINNDNSFNNNNITAIAQNRNGKIFIGTIGSGIKVFDPETKIFRNYTSSSLDNSLLSNSIQKIYISRDGIIWIGCWGGGVSCYDKRFERFIHYKQESQDKNSLFGSSVTCFTEDKGGNIWISTDGGGINKFNTKTAKFINFRSNLNDPRTLTNNKVLAIKADHKGGLWAGMWQGGLNYFKIEGDNLVLKKKYDFVDKNNLNSNSIFNIYVSNNDEVWVGNYSTGLYKLDPITDNFKSVELSSNHPNYNSIRCITSDSHNNIWISSETLGLVKIDRDSGEMERFVHNEKDSTSLINLSINVVFEDSKKRLWVGGDGCGINLFDPKTKSFTHYLKEQGLPDNSVVGILEDGLGNLWISTLAGISRATIVANDSGDGKLILRFKNFTVQDGLQGKVFNRWAYLKSSNGEMYFGGLNGFNVFFPDSIKENSFVPPVHLTDFLIFNKPVAIGEKGSPLSKHISQAKEIVLNHDQSVITFRYIALNFIFSEKNQYAYKLDGFDKEWNYVGNKKEATYTNLNPGKYIFRVKASNNDGIWNEEGVSIQITVLPPWWQTWWFRISVAFLIVFLIYLFFNFRLRVYRNVQKQLSELVKQRTQDLEEANTLLIEKNIQLDEINISKDKFFSIIAHDLKNPFGTIIGLSSLLIDEKYQFSKDEQKELIRNIHTSTEKIYSLLENLLMWSSSQLNRIKITPSFYNLTNQIYQIISLLDDFAMVKNIKLIFDEDKEVIIFADMQMIDTVLRNLITNAIKFSSENDPIKIELIEDNDKEICSIADQGVGMTSEQITNLFKLDKVISTEGTQGEKGTGLGLSLCLDFLEKNGGTIWVKSTPGNGSTFYFSLPTKN
jgi:signal transduction histidine kinase/ligand-binding sensor domain-containing protein